MSIPFCQHCQNPLPGRKPHKKSTNGFVFCNLSCATTYNNKAYRQKLTKCKSCTEIIYKHQTYCGKCWLKVKYNSNFKDEQLIPLEYRSLEEGAQNCYHRSNRFTKVREHARKVFKYSGKPYSCQICNYSKHVHISHIKSISSFPEDTPIYIVNHIDNLVGLCPNHHWEFDHGLILLDSMIDFQI